jgi:hypothetical protein
MTSFGFTFLSRTALGQAERLLFGGTAGVRDEVGFLIVHQRYSDYFFPGTSVLHTRLRYALIVPWIYQSLKAKRPAPKDFAQAFIEMEHQITGRLQYIEDKGGEKDGVIGGEVFPRAISQPPAYVYWTALAKWGLIDSRPNGRTWSRQDLARLLAATGKRTIYDDDGKPIESINWPITNIVSHPPDWDSDGKLTLDLRAPEKKFLAGKLRSVRSPLDPSKLSLLAKLVGMQLGAAENCWDKMILAVAGHDERKLKRAGQAAALSAIGRAIYAAQVETMKEVQDHRPQPDLHRAALKEAIAVWGRQASQLDMDLFLEDMGNLPISVETVLKKSWEWVRKSNSDPMVLKEVYARAEISRKGDRARLSDNQFGVDRRMEWQAENHPRAEPLHYRWGNVKRLLRDLEGVA